MKHLLTLHASLLALGLAAGCGGVEAGATPSDQAPAASACKAAKIQILAGHAMASEPFDNVDVATGGDGLYWLTFSTTGKTQSIYGVSRCGGTPAELVSGFPNPSLLGVAADDDQVYFTVVEPGSGTNAGAGAVMRVARVGGVPVVLAQGQPLPGAILVDDTRVYWTVMTAPGGVTAIRAMPKAGGAVVTLAEDQVDAAGLAANDNALVWIARTGEVEGHPVGALRSVPKRGGPVFTVAAGVHLGVFADALAVDATDAYLVEESADGLSANLVAAPLSGGVPVPLAAVGALPTTGQVPGNVPSGLATDGAHVYWTEVGGAVRGVSVLGGETFTLASDVDSPIGLRVDASSIYWLDLQGNVWKAAKS